MGVNPLRRRERPNPPAHAARHSIRPTRRRRVPSPVRGRWIDAPPDRVDRGTIGGSVRLGRVKLPDLRRLPPTAPRRRVPRSGRGPGRALRRDSEIQRVRPAPGHRHFGSATSRTSPTDATAHHTRCKSPSANGCSPTAPPCRSRQGAAPTERTTSTATNAGATPKHCNHAIDNRGELLRIRRGLAPARWRPVHASTSDGLLMLAFLVCLSRCNRLMRGITTRLLARNRTCLKGASGQLRVNRGSRRRTT